MRFLGLNGYARSGKDAAASTLVADGWQRIAFADVLRDMALAIDPYVELSGDIDGEPWYDNTDYYRLSGVVEWLGWERAKEEHPDVRRLLQRLGTEAGRDILGEDIWVDTALNRIEPGVPGVVFTDVRFPNEADRIKGSGGQVIRIVRPGVGPVNAHASDNSLEDYVFDAILYNDDSLESLYDKVKVIAYGER